MMNRAACIIASIGLPLVVAGSLPAAGSAAIRLKPDATGIGVAIAPPDRAAIQHHPAWTAPAEAALRPNPLANRPDAEAGGRKLFLQRCANCHGDDGRGGEKGPDLTLPDVQAQSDGALFWKITQGNTRGGMPTFSFLPELQRWQLVLHVRAAAAAGRR